MVSDDYPLEALRNGEQGVVAFVLTVGPDGAVQNCTVAEYSGSTELDNLTCTLLTKRARFVPATDGSGQRTIGSYSSRVRWVLPGMIPLQLPLDFAESFIVEADGKITECRVERTAGISSTELAKRKTLCELGFTSTPYRDAAGKAVRRRIRVVRAIEILPAE